MVVDKAKNTNENWLSNAVRFLKGKNIISNDKDVAEATGYSKGSVSSMISGTIPISLKFETKFKEKYGKHIDGINNNIGEPAVAYITREKHLEEMVSNSNQKIKTFEELVASKDQTISEKDKRIAHLEENSKLLRDLAVTRKEYIVQLKEVIRTLQGNEDIIDEDNNDDDSAFEEDGEDK